MCSDIAIRVSNLSKHYFLYRTPKDRLKQFLWRGRRKFFHEVRALENVSFEIKRGESVGIIGANGSGKSSLLQIICGTLTASSGEAKAHGRISALLELGTGFNPQFTGRENVFLNGAILGLTHAQVAEKFDSIAEFAGIGEFIHHPVSTYSSGMVVRLAFAVAIATEPDILVVDEALAVGDEAFQRKCFARIAALKERGCTLLFVSHSARSIVEVCDRALVMDGGEMILDAAPKTAVALYQKLLYAPPAGRAALRMRIRALPAGVAADSVESLLGEEPASSAQYDPVMVPESRIAFAPRGAVIHQPRLITMEGVVTNQLARRARYIFSYETEFTEGARQVRFGMTIKTPTGILIAGGNTRNHQGPIGEVAAGSRVRVNFTFTCLLMPGTYYINCSCSGIPAGAEEEIFLHRILDAASFRVLPEAGFTSGSIADLMVEPEVIMQNTPAQKSG